MQCESMTGAMVALAAAVMPALVQAAPTPEELAKMAQNPVANLITAPFQNNTNFNVGPLPVNMRLGAYYNVVAPDNGADWQVRF